MEHQTLLFPFTFSISCRELVLMLFFPACYLYLCFRPSILLITLYTCLPYDVRLMCILTLGFHVAIVVVSSFFYL